LGTLEREIERKEVYVHRCSNFCEKGQIEEKEIEMGMEMEMEIEIEMECQGEVKAEDGDARRCVSVWTMEEVTKKKQIAGPPFKERKFTGG